MNTSRNAHWWGRTISIYHKEHNPDAAWLSRSRWTLNRYPQEYDEKKHTHTPAINNTNKRWRCAGAITEPDDKYHPFQTQTFPLRVRPRGNNVFRQTGKGTQSAERKRHRGENTAVCVRDFMQRLYMHLLRSTVCVCDKCIEGTVGRVLKISHTLSSMCSPLQRDYEALKMEREGGSALPVSKSCVVHFSGVAPSRKV